MDMLRAIRDRLLTRGGDHDDIHAWRAQVLSVMAPAMVVLGFIAAAPSIAMAIHTRLWSVGIIDSVAFAWVVAIWRVRSLSYRLRAWNFCALFYAVGALLLFKIGHASQIYLMAFPVMAALLLGPRPALFALLLNAVTLFAGGYLIDADIYLAGLNDRPLLKWSVITINFMIVNSLITLTTVMLLRGIEDSLNRRRESERRYRTLTEWTPEPMAVHRNGRIIYANRAAIRVLGANSEEELLGRHVLEFVHPDYRQIARERIREMGEDGASPPMIEEKIVRLDGSLIDAEVQGVPIIYGGEPAIQIAMRDVTERKRAERERDELERRLLQAQKMEAIGNLAGGIAHDFNNLLAVILGRLQMTSDELADRPQLRAWIEACIKAANRGATLTRSMLAFSRLQPLRPVRIDVAASLHETVGLLRHTLGEAIDIKDVYAADLWSCEADPAQLQTALLNLALNARDAMPEGGSLTIEARNFHFDAGADGRSPDMSPGDYVAISVTDTGTGMAPEIVEKAFDPFFTTKDVGKGSGLGLSMVYGFVKQSGGHVRIDSEVGSGTTVSLYFPRASATTREEAEGRPPVPATGGNEEILVVEDAKDMRDLAVAQLRQLGYTVYTAGQGSDALPLIARHPGIALLLTDISLPGGMNGRTVAERALEMRPALKVLYMSGYSREALVHEGRLDLGVRLLQKPFRKEELAAQVRAAFADA